MIEDCLKYAASFVRGEDADLVSRKASDKKKKRAETYENEFGRETSTARLLLSLLLSA